MKKQQQGTTFNRLNFISLHSYQGVDHTETHYLHLIFYIIHINVESLPIHIVEK